MLKFYRRIRQKLIDEGNLKRYLIYAIGETLLVVLGILIALQINNWNEDRKNKSEEQKALNALNEELKSNKKQLANKIADCEEIIRSDSILLISMSNPNHQISEEQLSLIIDQLTIPYTYNPEDGVLRDIINSGKLSILQNQELRYILTSWESKFSDIKEVEMDLLNSINTMINPFFFEYYSKRNVGMKSLFGESRFSFSPKQILENKFLENIIVQNWQINSHIKSRYIKLNKEILQTIEIIEEQIKNDTL